MGNSMGWSVCNCKEKKKKSKPEVVVQKQEKQSESSFYANESPPLENDNNNNNNHLDYLDQYLRDEKVSSTVTQMRGHTQSFAMRFNQDGYFKRYQMLYYKNHYNVKPRKINPRPFK